MGQQREHTSCRMELPSMDCNSSIPKCEICQRHIMFVTAVQGLRSSITQNMDMACAWVCSVSVLELLRVMVNAVMNIACMRLIRLSPIWQKGRGIIFHS